MQASFFTTCLCPKCGDGLKFNPMTGICKTCGKVSIGVSEQVNSQFDRAEALRSVVERANDPSFWDEQETILRHRQQVVDLEAYRIRKQSRRRK